MQDADVRRGVARCRSGRHELVPEDVYTNPSGRWTCRGCMRITEQKRRKVKVADSYGVARCRSGAHELMPDAVDRKGEKWTCGECRRSGQLKRTLKRHGLTIEQYEAMLEDQGGRCAICGGTDSQRRLNVDHDHATGEVRGLLCSGCNGAKLGRLQDDPDRAIARAEYHEERAWMLRSAAEYLLDPPSRRVL